MLSLFSSYNQDYFIYSTTLLNCCRALKPLHCIYRYSPPPAVVKSMVVELTETLLQSGLCKRPWKNLGH